MSAEQTVIVTRDKKYQAPGRTGYVWKWRYFLPSRQQITSDGREVRLTPGGFSTKAETLDLIRQLYTARPLLVEWPDGRTSEVKR
jgi:hypothetical protein